MKLFRIILAAPFVLIGAAFYKVGELISGEIYTRHADVVENNTIYRHKFHEFKMNNRGNNRTPAKKKRKK